MAPRTMWERPRPAGLRVEGPGRAGVPGRARPVGEAGEQDDPVLEHPDRGPHRVLDRGRLLRLEALDGEHVADAAAEAQQRALLLLNRTPPQSGQVNRVPFPSAEVTAALGSSASPAATTGCSSASSCSSASRGSVAVALPGSWAGSGSGPGSARQCSAIHAPRSATGRTASSST